MGVACSYSSVPAGNKILPNLCCYHIVQSCNEVGANWRSKIVRVLGIFNLGGWLKKANAVFVHA